MYLNFYSDSKFIAKTMKQTGMQSVSVCVSESLCVYMCVCAWARGHMCEFECICCTSMYACVCVRVCMRVHVGVQYKCVWVCACVHALYTNLCVCMHVCVYKSVCLHALHWHMCVHVCMYNHVSTFACIHAVVFRYVYLP